MFSVTIIYKASKMDKHIYNAFIPSFHSSYNEIRSATEHFFQSGSIFLINNCST